MRTIAARLDKVGMMASTLCAIHCAALPLVLGLLPLIGLGFFASTWFEYGMVSFAGIVGFTAMLRGHRIHHSHTTWCFFVLGLGLLLTALFAFGCTCCSQHAIPRFDPVHRQIVYEAVSSAGLSIRSVLMTAGGLCVAAAHFINMKLCNSCHDCTTARGI